MAKKNKPDKLARENAQALAAGMSYGKWKALQPVTPIKPKRPAEAYIERVCVQCGCTFVCYNKKERKYCGDRCRNKAYYEREYAKNKGGAE